MRSFFTFLFSILLTSLFAQDVQSISTGPGYSLQSYVSLSEGTETQVGNTAWDIAFSADGLASAGIFINESSGTGQGTIELFNALTLTFAEVPDPSNFESFPLYNSEASWDYGAFNEAADLSDPFDLGWGTYNFMNHQIHGNKVFAIKMRDDVYRKIFIESLIGNVYTVKHALLDGSDEQTFTINKDDFSSNLAYFNLTTNSPVEVEPANFDLIYLRYITPLFDPGTETTIPYLVTGIFTAPGVAAAQADGVDPNTVNYEDYQNSFNDSLITIGYDWKTFTGSGWSLPADRVYFVRTADDHVWKIHFIDFEGSSTGTGVFEKTDLGVLSSIPSLEEEGIQVNINPNPTVDQLYISLNADKLPKGNYVTQVVNSLGQQMWTGKSEITSGFTVNTIETNNWASGQYFITINDGKTSYYAGTVIKL